MSDKIRSPMSDLERRAANALSRCVFVPGTATKRFAREMATLALCQDARLTEAQRRYLFTACYRFRGQIHDRDVLTMAAAYKDLPREVRP